jgi:hypothetical protein
MMMMIIIVLRTCLLEWSALASAVSLSCESQTGTIWTNVVFEDLYYTTDVTSL